MHRTECIKVEVSRPVYLHLHTCSSALFPPINQPAIKWTMPCLVKTVRWRQERRESLNSGPLPASAIDCRVHRVAFALRYHYSSIDRPALKSKSHLVARATVSGSGDLEMFVTLCLHVCVCVCSSLPSFSHHQLISILSHFLCLTHTHTHTQSTNVCFICRSRKSGSTHRHTHSLSVTELCSIHTHASHISHPANAGMHTPIHNHTSLQLTSHLHIRLGMALEMSLFSSDSNCTSGSFTIKNPKLGIDDPRAHTIRVKKARRHPLSGSPTDNCQYSFESSLAGLFTLDIANKAEACACSRYPVCR